MTKNELKLEMTKILVYLSHYSHFSHFKFF